MNGWKRTQCMLQVDNIVLGVGGASFYISSTDPACYRASLEIESTHINIGFRVVLYMK